MIYVIRSLVMLLILELVLCGYLMTQKMFHAAPSYPAFKVDDAFLQERIDKLAVLAEQGETTAWQELAEALLGHGYYGYAELNYKQVLKQNPDNYDAQFGLAFCLDKMGRTEESTLEYRKVIATKPTSGAMNQLRLYAMYAVGKNFLRVENLVEAEEEFRSNINFAPAEYQLAKLLIRTGQPEEALQIIEKNLEKVPRALSFHYLKYLALQNLGRNEEAQAAAVALEDAEYLVDLKFNGDYIEPFYVKYGQPQQ